MARAMKHISQDVYQRAVVDQVAPNRGHWPANRSKDLAKKSGPAGISQDLLLRMVHSLYADRVMPQASLLQWRLIKEIGVKLSANDLRCLVTPMSELYISGLANTRGLAFSVLLNEKPNNFEGFADESGFEAVLPDGLVIEAAVQLLRGGWQHGDDPRHDKYEITDWIRARSETLASIPWGQVLRIVRWFMASNVQVLGKKGSRIVPYPLSDNFDKEENARLLRPTGLRPGEKYVSSWESLVSCLETLMDKNNGWVRISELKKNFRTEFAQELTETAFGHTTLFGLLSDGRCADTVMVEKVGGADAIWLRKTKLCERGEQSGRHVDSDKASPPTSQRTIEDDEVIHRGFSGAVPVASQLQTPSPRQQSRQSFLSAVVTDTPLKTRLVPCEPSSTKVRKPHLVSDLCSAAHAGLSTPVCDRFEHRSAEGSWTSTELPLLPTLGTSRQEWASVRDDDDMVCADYGTEDATPVFKHGLPNCDRVSVRCPHEKGNAQTKCINVDVDCPGEDTGDSLNVAAGRDSLDSTGEDDGALSFLAFGDWASARTLPPWCRIQNTFLATSVATPTSKRAASAPPLRG